MPLGRAPTVEEPEIPTEEEPEIPMERELLLTPVTATTEELDTEADLSTEDETT